MAHVLLNLEKRVQCVRLFAKTGNITEAFRIIKTTCEPSAPTRKTVARINKLFNETGSVANPK